MKHGPFLFLGAFVALSASFAGLIVRPQIQLGNLRVAAVVNGDGTYPSARPGLAAQGREVYRANGCFYCHSQQVQGKQGDLSSELISGDIDRGWGQRQTTARDYIYDRPVMLGSQRVGPDLANWGARDATQAPGRTLRYLYNPRMDQAFDSTPSSMPGFPFLFEKRKRAPGQRRTPGALILSDPFDLPGYEIVPKESAIALVAYLKSLNAGASIPEAPLPTTNAVAKAGSTNAPAGLGTNAPAGSTTNGPAGSTTNVTNPPKQ